MAQVDHLPVTLIDVLANSVVLRQIAPYIPFRSLLDLAATNKSIRDIIVSQPEPWRYLDLTRVKSAKLDSTPLDVGGISWRSQRMDEALTEDDFYAGALRGVFSRLRRKQILKMVQTMVLDGLSVPADIVREIATENQYSVKILSIREATNLNQSKLQQVLRNIVRPTRSEGTPRLKALYYFGPKDSTRWNIWQQQRPSVATGVTTSEGAQIGAAWNQRSSTALSSTISDDEMRWYSCTGRAMKRPQSDWPEAIRACKGLIAFDAVLCRGPRHDISKVDSKNFLQPAIATVALGPSGCESCGSCPEGPAIFGGSPEYALPLLSPPPTHSSTVQAALRPQNISDVYPKLIARCEDCLRSRWCERCNRWWCEECYVEPVSRIDPTEMQQRELRDQLREGGWESVTRQVYEGAGPQIKGVHRDCLECGRTCELCKSIYIRTCLACKTEYCVEHDDGCSVVECAWCSRGGRRARTRELY